MILVLLGSTKSGRVSGSATPGSGVSKGGKELALSPVSQLNKPPEAGLVATALEVANLVAPKLLPLPYSHGLHNTNRLDL